MSDEAGGWPKTEGFAVLPARQFLAHPESVRDTMGVYVILIRGGDELLSRAGYQEAEQLAPWSHRAHYHLYTGESIGVRSRLMHHLCGTVKESNFRHSLLALQFARRVLWPEHEERMDVLEGRLSEWLHVQAMVAFRFCSYVVDVETDLLRRSPSPLNIKGRAARPFARLLKADRSALTRHMKETGQVQHYAARTPSAWLTGGRTNHLAGEP